MATYNFLDKTGLGLVWVKIKALIPTKTSDLQNDSNFITSSDVPVAEDTQNVIDMLDELGLDTTRVLTPAIFETSDYGTAVIQRGLPEEEEEEEEING